MKLTIKGYYATSARNRKRSNSIKINAQLTVSLKHLFGKHIFFKYDRILDSYVIELCETIDLLSHKDCKKIGKAGNFSVRLTDLEEGEYNIEQISETKYKVFK